MLSLSARTWRLATPVTRSFAPAPWRGKKKKAGKRTGGGASQADLPAAVSELVDFPHFETNMQKAVDVLHDNFSRIRAGGASPGMLDGILVQAYGTSTVLEKVAQVSVKDGRTLMVNVFDDQTTGAVEKAIRSAGLNLNPVKDGQGRFRVPVPKKTEQARQSLAKIAVKDAEAAKVATRMVRRKAMDAVKGLKDDVTKDDFKRMENVVQQMSDKYVHLISHSLEEKIKSINVT
eukprot:GFKZ01006872.1.p2 GENE.GFKZ01006872.1~~GFKZ01006872.1.p2  ORF type:complete len:233 (-),score=42.22 GFKZ01006872.1:1824-2522(-)